MIIGLISGVAATIAALVFIFMGGFYWRDGSKKTSALNVAAGLVMLVAQVISALAFLGEHLPPQ